MGRPVPIPIPLLGGKGVGFPRDKESPESEVQVLEVYSKARAVTYTPLPQGLALGFAPDKNCPPKMAVFFYLPRHRSSFQFQSREL